MTLLMCYLDLIVRNMCFGARFPTSVIYQLYNREECIELPVSQGPHLQMQ